MRTFDVKKRQYFGNTSMEAEISLLMANQTLVWFLPTGYDSVKLTRLQASPGKLIYDPFIGTGSMAYVG
jgi:tRNA (guanine10-N2)-methyltransferase